MSKPITIDETLFWKLYNQLLNAERLYWETDGIMGDDEVNEQLMEAYHEVVGLLNDLEPIVTSLKEDQGLYA
jgi:hypothetical protein